ncbi:hypothetical protein BRADI_3g34947v3 [Brachypodium distachyon]|uniref:Uncharacterized protein n=1 Tax=Brachypodium distachyon TaxID=15368 RepID=A0A2K2D188_BRADI|nr:hypothetical protein BRADI_3g34947v3 [Brachypodium distachyon]
MTPWLLARELARVNGQSVVHHMKEEKKRSKWGPKMRRACDFANLQNSHPSQILLAAASSYSFFVVSVALPGSHFELISE